MFDIKKFFLGRRDETPLEEPKEEPKVERFKFRVNQRILLKPAEGPAGVSYRTVVQDVTENIVFVSLPIVNGEYILVRRGEVYEGTLYDPTGMYTFSVVTVNRLMRPVPMIALEKPAQVRRFQQRSYPRVRAYLDVIYRPLQGVKEFVPDLEPDKEIVWTRDISAGGLCVVVDRDLPVGLDVAMRITLPRDYSAAINCRGIVKRCLSEEYSATRLAGIEFTRIDASDQASIDRFVSASERL
jgi:c-di-GMP-binding flagellar brake protein YcgR